MLEPIRFQEPNKDSKKVCCKCGKTKASEDFPFSKNWFSNDARGIICNECIREYLKSNDFRWEAVDRVCMSLNLPFIPKKFEELREVNKENVFPIYSRFFRSSEYERFEWKDYDNKFRELQQKNLLDRELPGVKDEYYDNLRLRWGMNYDEEELTYLESLYNGILASQNVSGALSTDQAQKLCKISLNIDERIRSGTDFDKMMASYEKLTKIADFTPKNSRSDNDLSSMGEVVAWLEKRGWINKWYDGANKDIVDEVIRSNQAFVQRLYTDESGLGDEVTERIQQLKLAAEIDKKDSELELKRFSEEDNFFDFEEADLEKYDNETFEEFTYEEAFESDSYGV